VAALLAVGLTLTACSTVPTSSPTVPITQVPSRQDADVGIEPLAPEPGATPEEIVRGFIDASASPGRGHPVAREYLNGRAADEWADDGGVTVIEPGFATVTRQEGVVELTAQTVGTVNQQGTFSVGGTQYTRDFTVERVGDEWRITNPPAGLVVVQPDFERVYDQLNVYFVDPTGKRVVPDPRYLVEGEAQPTALVQRLFEGPSSTLRPGVVNPLADLTLRRPVAVEGSAAVVDLAGLPAEPAFPLEELCAQLVWTLEQARIRSVEVLVDGEPVPVSQVPRAQTTDDWAAYDPDFVPVDAVGHYIDGTGALRTAPDGEPVPGPAGEGAYRFRSAAAATDQASRELSFLVGVVPAEGGDVDLLAGPYEGPLALVLRNSRTLTPPTVAATRAEIWTVRNGTAVVRVPSGAAPQDVTAPTLDALGRVEALQLSPDGVRAALITEGLSGPELYLGVVERGDEQAVTLRDLREVNPEIDDPVDVAWRTSDSLMVLASDPSDTRIVPWEVGVDGWGLSEVPTSGLPADANSVAAAPNQEPLVSAGEPGERTIWRLIGGTWGTLVRGLPPQPGTEPFYPL
jgi:hypothetical protein